MGHVDLTQGISDFLVILNLYIQILKDTTFTIGSVTFSLWGLMWSLVFLFMFIGFLWSVLGDTYRIGD